MRSLRRVARSIVLFDNESHKELEVGAALFAYLFLAGREKVGRSSSEGAREKVYTLYPARNASAGISFLPAGLSRSIDRASFPQ